MQAVADAVFERIHGQGKNGQVATKDPEPPKATGSSQGGEQSG